MDYIEGFVHECQARGLTAHTIESYRSNVKTFLQHCKEPCTVNVEELRAFLGELRARDLAGSTLKEYFASISAFYDFLMFEGKVPANPVIPFRRRYLRIKMQYNGENTRQPASIEQMREIILLAARNVLHKTMLLFLPKTGVRRGEFIAMDVEDLKLSEYLISGEFRVKPKAKRSNRLGFMDSELCMQMREYLDWREPRARDNALWITPAGYRVTRNYVYHTVTHYASMAGLHNPAGAMNEKFTPHCCRHTFTTWLRRAGMPREFIKELRGDRRKDAIDIYDHIEVEELRRSYLKCIPHLNIGPGRAGTLEEWIK